MTTTDLHRAHHATYTEMVTLAGRGLDYTARYAQLRETLTSIEAELAEIAPGR